MSEWKKVKIGDFLTEREGRYKPNDKEILKYQRLDKIDFSGHIHISDKPTKTNMIIVFPGDLIISGINVAKGAISVYQGKEPVCATIHYSSYTFDDKKVDLDYFKYFVKSPAFIFALQQQVKGGIKTEIKPKHLLPLEISLPDLSTQKEIVKVLSKKIEKVELIKSEIESQKAYAKQLRQNILQEAIEGKLTEEWRKKNPVVKGNPDFDAEALFEKIQEEKCHTNSKKKVFEPIAENELPFEIPEGWKWVRLGEICEGFMYGTSAKSLPSGKCPVLRMGNIQNGKIDWEKLVYTNNDEEIEKYLLKQYDLLFNRTNSREMVGKTAIFESTQKTIYAGYLVKFRPINSNPYFVNIVLNSKTHREWCNEVKTDALGQSNINAEKLKNFVAPLPPLTEQKEIVSRVEKLLANVTELEKQITEREEMTKQLMQSIMKDAFREV